MNMRTSRICCLELLAVALISGTGFAQDAPFTQRENVVYAEAHGVGLLMDVFTPTGEKNGLAIIDVISGAWHSDRGKIRDHTLAQTFHILCRKGYTVFAIRPGSITKFGAMEMVVNLDKGIRWVKDHAAEYGINPERLGMMGASAGGHLACLSAVYAPAAANPGSPVAAKVTSTRVKAVAAFFPPTDFLNYGGKAVDVHGNDRLGRLVRVLIPHGGPGTSEPEDVARMLTTISPARLVKPHAPPFLLIHGDADPLVPLQQSEVMLEALKKAGVPAELIVKKGGGHPWLALHEEVQVLAEWFDKQLGAQ
jgi:acetyl esterase/lipase